MKYKNALLALGIVVLSGLIWYLVSSNLSKKVYSSANVSCDEVDTYAPYICLDSHDNPSILWVSSRNELHFTKWDGESWVNIEGEKPYYKNGENRIISDDTYVSGVKYFGLNSDNNPEIIWETGSPIKEGNLVFRRWKGLRKWLNINGSPKSIYHSGFGNPIGTIAVVADIKDDYHVLAYNTVRIEDKMVYKPAYLMRDETGWKNIGGELFENNNAYLGMTLPSKHGHQIVLDRDENPCILWDDDSLNVDGNIHFIRWNGQNWVTVSGEKYDPMKDNANITRSAARLWGKKVRIDSKNNPHILWYQKSRVNGNDYVYSSYIKWDGTNWVHLDGTHYNPNKIEKIYQIKLTYRHSPTFDFCLDENDNPKTVWCDHTDDNWNVYYSQWDGWKWVNAFGFDAKGFDNCIVSHSQYDAINQSFVLDSKGYPHIVWKNFMPSSEYDAFYVKWDDTGWVCADGTPYEPAEYKEK